jgi:hypothetical protein
MAIAMIRASKAYKDYLHTTCPVIWQRKTKFPARRTDEALQRSAGLAVRI